MFYLHFVVYGLLHVVDTYELRCPTYLKQLKLLNILSSRKKLKIAYMRYLPVNLLNLSRTVIEIILIKDEKMYENELASISHVTNLSIGHITSKTYAIAKV